MTKRTHTTSFSWAFVLVLLSVFGWTGCTNNVVTEQRPAVGRELKFSGILPDDKELRATGTSWDVGDRIGVFAVGNNATLGPTTLIDGADNVPFVTANGDGAFRSESKPIRMPLDGTSMDVIAYYPYRADLSGFDYPIDLDEQVDVLYSNNAKGITSAMVPARLRFGHALSKLVLKVSATSGVSLDGLKVVVEDSPTRAMLSLATGKLTSVDESSVGSFALAVTDGDASKVVTGLMLPGRPAGSVKLRFVIGSQSYTWALPREMEAGKYYEYSIKLDKVLSATPVATGLMELPVRTAGGTAPNTIQVMHMVEERSWVASLPHNDINNVRNYSICYDTEHRMPLWVAYPMHPMYLGSAGRTNDWGYDPKVQRSLQPELSGGWKGSGYDRGHLLASADRNYSRGINSTTFYYTNLGAQAGKMNQGTWNELENRVRNWCRQSQYDTLYVVTGCILPEAPERVEKIRDNAGKFSSIPKYFYKALARKHKTTGKYSTVAFMVENVANAAGYARSVVSVEEIERRTGFTFFPNIPADQSAEAKKNTDMSGWN